jgi:molecular chaperone DnaK
VPLPDPPPPAPAVLGIPLAEIDGIAPEAAEPVAQVGARPGAMDAWDLISDLIDGPAPAASGSQSASPAPAEPLEAFVPSGASWPDTGYMLQKDRDFETSSGEYEAAGLREPGEVTPLARIELVRSPPSSPIRIATEVDPLEPPAEPPVSTAIPSKRLRPQIDPPSPRILAIDLGTTSAWASTPGEGGRVSIVESRRGTESIPAAVIIKDNGKTIVGEPALRKLGVHPEHAILDTRRLIGLAFGSGALQRALPHLWSVIVRGDEGEAAVRVGPFTISIEEIAALLLKEIRESTLMSLGENVNRVVLTCPATFGHRQREGLLVAGELAALHVERIVSEPIAAAVHYGTDRGLRNRTLFVYRFGGGTFDATIIRVDGDRYTAVAAGGDTLLGGAELDRALSTLLADEVARGSGLDPRGDRRAMVGVLEAARTAKHLLSEHERAKVYVEPSFGGGEPSFRMEVEVSREQVEILWAPLIDQSIAICREVCARAGLAPSEIDDLVLIGGQVRAPIIQRKVRELFGKRGVDVDPDRAAVLGAGRIAERLGTEAEIAVGEILQHTISISMGRGAPVALLSRGAQLPAAATFSVHPQNATRGRVDIAIAEGEAHDPIGVIQLGSVVVSIELSFRVDSNGILEVTAADVATRESIPVCLQLDLTAEPPSSPEAGPERKDSGIFGWIRKRFMSGRATLEK